MLEIIFGDFPVMETHRLRLRQISETDADALYSIRSYDAVMQYIGKRKPKDVEEIKTLIETIRRGFEDATGINWAIVPKGSDTIIGTIGFWRLDKPNHRGEIGYLLHPDYWRKGIASEAMQAVITYGFHSIGFHSIEANVAPENDASKKLLLKMGFKQEAYFRENYYFDGQFLDSAIFCLLKHEYKSY